MNFNLHRLSRESSSPGTILGTLVAELSTIKVSADALACSPTPGSFGALSFQLAVPDISETGGAGTRKVTFGDPASGARTIKTVVFTEMDKSTNQFSPLRCR
jgi:hypothetical protein